MSRIRVGFSIDGVIKYAYFSTKEESEKYIAEMREKLSDKDLDGEIWKDIKEEESLHKWFSRKGGGGHKGWVDCNTCREVDGKTKCKPCGREKGEKRSKYPSCRPTPSACGTPKKGKSWGKKSGKTNENLSLPKNLSIFVGKNHIKNMLRETFNQDDTMTEPAVKPAEPAVKPTVIPQEPQPRPIRREDKPFLPMPNVQPDPKAKR